MTTEAWTAAKILIIDDEPANVRLLERLLTVSGYKDLDSVTDPRLARERFRTVRPDLVLLDLTMPYLDGIAVLEQLRAEMPADVYLPVLILTADATIEAKRRALQAGANDFLTKPFEQIEVVLRIGNLLATRRLYLALAAQNETLEQTVRQRTERLLQSEKVATMGSLLAGVAHELNNPLMILSGQAQLLREASVDPAVVTRSEKIEAAADRCVRIVRNFLALARSRGPERGDVLLGLVVDGAVELLAYELRTDGIEVVLDIAPHLPRLWADAHQLHQVLVNLIGNAHHALRGRPAPRRITITARRDAAHDGVSLDVSDTGPGIPAEVQARIFEPFFTTKPVGEGTGLGLSLSRGIIEGHGGTLTVHSEPGLGTRFSIVLPVGAVPAAPDTGRAEPRLAPIGGKTVLIVDDEPEVAAIVAEALASDGHKADIATNGAMGLEMMRCRQYDLVFSDTKMPILDGERFYAEMERHFPELRNRIIFLTGDSLGRDKREFLERTGAPFLTKPCDLGEVRRVAHQVLAGTGRPS